MAGTKTHEQTETKTKTRTARPWKVIVHDDPVTLMSYVTQALRDIFGYGPQKAQKLMMTVHEQGKAIVWTGGRERAEVYAAKCQARHLLTSLEQVED